MRARIGFDAPAVGALCRRWHVQRLAFFGSVLRDDFGPTSDVDVLVEFEPGRTPGLSFFALERELSTALGRRVDLHTPGFLSPLILPQVARDAETAYVQA